MKALMGERMTKVSFRLPPSVQADFEALAERGEFGNVQDVYREAIRRMLRDYDVRTSLPEFMNPNYRNTAS